MSNVLSNSKLVLFISAIPAQAVHSLQALKSSTPRFFAISHPTPYILDPSTCLCRRFEVFVHEYLKITWGVLVNSCITYEKTQPRTMSSVVWSSKCHLTILFSDFSYVMNTTTQFTLNCCTSRCISVLRKSSAVHLFRLLCVHTLLMTSTYSLNTFGTGQLSDSIHMHYKRAQMNG